jgi:hypothetical protein
LKPTGFDKGVGRDPASRRMRLVIGEAEMALRGAVAGRRQKTR